MKKVEIINDIIKKAGVPCPTSDVILKTINQIGVDFNNVIDKYDQYILSHRILNFGTEEKYIGKDNKLLNLDEFVYKHRYQKDYPLPQTNLTKALFGKSDFYQLVKSFNKINKKISVKRMQALIKFEMLIKEKNNKLKEKKNDKSVN